MTERDATERDATERRRGGAIPAAPMDVAPELFPAGTPRPDGRRERDRRETAAEERR